MTTAPRTTPRALLAAALLLLLAAALSLPLASGTAQAATRQVVIEGYAYSPATLTITVGTTVTWTNEDTAAHDVQTSSGPATLDSPMLDQGEQWSYTFTTAGTYDYYCTVHPEMTARVVVEEATTETTEDDEHHHDGSSGGSGGSGSGASTSSAGADGSGSQGGTSSGASTGGEDEQDSGDTHDGHTTDETTTDTDGDGDGDKAADADASSSASPTASATTATSGETAESSEAAESLDPLLIVTGIVTGIAVLCLLLAASRIQRGRP